MTSDAASGATTVRSVERCLDILEVLERSDSPLRLTDIARRAGQHPATTLRFLGALERRGMVVVRQQLYRLAVATLGMAHGFLSLDPLCQAARQVLQELATATKLAATLYVRSGADRVLVIRIEGGEPLRYQPPVGRRLPLVTGGGIPIAAQLSDADIERLLGPNETFVTSGGVVYSRKELREFIVAAKRDHVHLSNAQWNVGVSSISAAVIGRDEPALASISLSGPSELVFPDRLLRAREELLRATFALSHRF
ncbi:helix-turn-helix domain-containing protein [Micromonospora sp. NPDC005206]|uniref:IclR family transcriptional regulator n=1 Tax=Micromonospora sp. NPDC005206 TaxID=3157022 RepID=UPI0033BC26F5